MSVERLKVLELIKEGKITPEEGLELLSALQDIYEDEEKRELNLNIGDFSSHWNKNDLEISKFLKVNIQRSNGKKNINAVIPVSIVRFLGGLGTITVNIEGKEIDINEWWEKQDSGYKGIVLDTCTKSGKNIKVELI